MTDRGLADEALAPTAWPPCVLLHLPDVAAQLRVPVQTLRLWRAKDRGPRMWKVGRSVVTTQADLDAWLEQQRALGTGGHDAAA